MDTLSLLKSGETLTVECKSDRGPLSDADLLETVVLDYVRAHGRITRGEVMDLCRVNENQAAYLLRRLVQDGKLSRRGARRGAYYMLNMRKE